MASRWLWSSSRPSGSHPDGLELIQAIGKPSRRPGAHPGHWEAIPTAWSSSRPSGSHPDGLELIQAIGKPSRRPGGATVRALQKMLRALNMEKIRGLILKRDQDRSRREIDFVLERRSISFLKGD
ncbi:hypothetical protein KEM48_003149 [Puccinia striiformis f. sp. tritici PST-130]|nr:hypothetical protein KEM48_003149 [Puccinia striiformis f. sp. tritici PST-130]